MRAHTEKCVPMMRRWVHVPGRRLNALPSVQPRMRVARSTSRSGSPRRFLTRSSPSLAASPLLSSSLLLPPSPHTVSLSLFLSTLRALSDPVCVERAMGTKLYPRWFREKWFIFWKWKKHSFAVVRYSLGSFRWAPSPSSGNGGIEIR